MEIKITVERRRGSVTQGMVDVLINGEKVMDFGDTIELLKPGEKYYGPNIGGYASKTPDIAFVLGMLYHPHDDVYHLSDQVKALLGKLKEQEEQDAQTYKKVKEMRFVQVDSWRRMVFIDSDGKYWKYDEPGDLPLQRHDRLYDSTGNDIEGEPCWPMKDNIDYEIVGYEK